LRRQPRKRGRDDGGSWAVLPCARIASGEWRAEGRILLATRHSPLVLFQCSILTPVSATTLRQRAVSLVMSAVKSSGVPPMVDTPTSASRRCTSGSFTTELKAALSLATIAAGVFAGASTPDQLSATTSG